jgi:glycosyltransferase involved in cell wall biosynthesis
MALINQLRFWDNDINLLLPVRVTQAKNIELALHVVAALKARSICPKLVVTGPPDPHDSMNMEYFRSLLGLREQLGIIDQMRFVFESGPSPTEPFIINMSLVAELLRVSDALFMPSHREGFGMPVLEAGLANTPIFCADGIPAGNEIGGQEVVRFSSQADPAQVADLIINRLEDSSVFRLRKRIRQNLTWGKIFQQNILPLVDGGAS